MNTNVNSNPAIDSKTDTISNINMITNTAMNTLTSMNTNTNIKTDMNSNTDMNSSYDQMRKVSSPKNNDKEESRSNEIVDKSFINNSNAYIHPIKINEVNSCYSTLHDGAPGIDGLKYAI